MKEFEEDKDYQNIHELYQASSNELPPSGIDESILQAAHQAVESGSGAPAEQMDIQATSEHQFGVDTQPVKRAWYVPVSYVAILVISSSVVMKLALETDTAPLISEAEMYQPETAFMDQLEHKEQGTRPELKRSDPLTSGSRSLEDVNVESTVRASSPAASVVAPAPVPAQVKSPMKKAAPSIVASEMADEMLRQKQEIKTTQETLAKSKQRKSQGAMMSRSRLESDSLLLAEEADFASVERAEPKKIETLDITEDQQVLIDEIVQLFENEQYTTLEIKLKKYRVTYPRIKNKEALPGALLDWEEKNISEVLQLKSQKE